MPIQPLPARMYSASPSTDPGEHYIPGKQREAQLPYLDVKLSSVSMPGRVEKQLGFAVFLLISDG